MTRAVYFDLKGVEQLVRRLDKMPEKMRKSIERKALRKGLKEMESVAEGLAPVGPPKPENEAKIKDSFQVKTRTKKGQVLGHLKNKAPHAHLQEFGWFLTKGPRGGNQKIIKPVGQPYEDGPKPFIRPALDEKGEEIQGLMVEKAAELLREFKVS